jgi:hypothetical protein
MDNFPAASPAGTMNYLAGGPHPKYDMWMLPTKKKAQDMSDQSRNCLTEDPTHLRRRALGCRQKVKILGCK